jgi:SPP1 family predicted phage head-tail adaptor
MIATINPGELRDKIIIQEVNSILDDRGFPIEITVDLFTLRAKRKTVSTKEYISADKASSDLTYKFVCRKRAIDSTMKLKYKEQLFDIKHINEFEDGMFIEITAVVRK